MKHPIVRRRLNLVRYALTSHPTADDIAEAMAKHPSLQRRTPQSGRGYDPKMLYACLVIQQLIKQDWPMTVRQVFYRLVVAGVIDKKESEYQKVINWLGVMRLETSFHDAYPDLKLEWEYIVDSNRKIRQTSTFANIADTLENAARWHRLSVLARAKTHVEVWIEKEALAETLWEVTANYDVPLLAQPFASHSNAYLAAERIAAAYRAGKPSVILHLSDYDPSGQVMTNSMDVKLGKILRDHLDCPTETLEVRRLGLAREQIDKHNLPTRPTKRENNRHAAWFDDDESVELDALEPNVLREIVRNAIEDYIPNSLVRKVRRQEETQRAKLQEVAQQHE